MKSVRSGTSARGPCFQRASCLQVNKIAAFHLRLLASEVFPWKPATWPTSRVCVWACCPSHSLTWTAGLVFVRHKGAMWHVVLNSLHQCVQTKNTPPSSYLPPLHHTDTSLVGAGLHSALLPTHGLIYSDKAKNGKAPKGLFFIFFSRFPCMLAIYVHLSLSGWQQTHGIQGKTNTW